jgi:hypothetical protein
VTLRGASPPVFAQVRQRMFKIIGVLVVCLLIVLGLGVYFKWFTVSTSNAEGNRTDLHVGVNKDKIQEDLKAVKEGAQGLFGAKTSEGTVQQIDVSKQELTIVDKQQKELNLKADAGTKVKIADKDAAFGDLKVGDSVSATYDAKKEGNHAKTITVTKAAEKVSS